ncbi:MAG: Inositol 2-dehydrogenase/D-chiro-inositol 3-dehydrogenase [Lentisphaerae bacterium ADurb.Bin242]|nr:MAG: Inositol 2-dehydrogenase/D-chiro-inositol 3-dehydrogenase [Lentisphaerae bacterium ADurb.Bin242]
MKVRTALVGINGYAGVHLQHLKKLEKDGLIEMTAAVILPHERTPENTEWLRSAGCGIYDSLDDMFRQSPAKPELVCLPVGIPSHEPLTVCCLANGANVLLEKPAAGSLEAVDNMRRAEAESGGCFVAVGFQHVYSREIQQIKRILLSEQLGKLESVSVMGIWPRTRIYYSRNGWAGKIKTPSGAIVLDSPINNAFAHYLNVPLFLAGNAFEKSAHPVELEGQLYRARTDIEYFDTCGLQAKTADGISLRACFSHASDVTVHPLLTLKCRDGIIRIDFGNSRWNISGKDGSVQKDEPMTSLHADMFLDVVRKVSDRSVFTCSLDIAREHTFCIEWLYRNCVQKDLSPTSVEYRKDTEQAVIPDLPRIFREYFENSGPLILETGNVK